MYIQNKELSFIMLKKIRLKETFEINNAYFKLLKNHDLETMSHNNNTEKFEKNEKTNSVNLFFLNYKLKSYFCKLLRKHKPFS